MDHEQLDTAAPIAEGGADTIPQPSTAALGLAEELIDHVSYGLTRGEHIREIAMMIEDAYGELVASARAVASAEGAAISRRLARLREALRKIQGESAAATD